VKTRGEEEITPTYYSKRGSESLSVCEVTERGGWRDDSACADVQTKGKKTLAGGMGAGGRWARRKEGYAQESYMRIGVLHNGGRLHTWGGGTQKKKRRNP